jgi:hypothetical protein
MCFKTDYSFSLQNERQVKYYAVVFDGTVFIMCKQHIIISVCSTFQSGVHPGSVVFHFLKVKIYGIPHYNGHNFYLPN